MPSRRTVLAALAGAAGLAPAAARAGHLATGTSIVEVPEARGATSDPVRVHVHRPASWAPERPILVVMHGVRRDAGRYAAHWAPLAGRYGVLLVAPEFDARKFPGARFYNHAGMRGRGGRLAPPAEWTFGVVESAVDAVRQQAGARRESFFLYGHSAGAQFVHRFAMFHASQRLERAVAANAGWYTLPDFEDRFPYGLGGTGFTAESVAAMLRRPLVIQLGERDTDPGHPALRHGERADRQGENRLERGRFMMAAARGQAARLRVPLAWRMHVTPGIGHSDSGMSRDAARLLFG